MTISTSDALPVAVRRGATYRMQVDLRAASARPLDTVRLLLVADVLRRTVEDLCAGQVWLAVVARQVSTNSPLRRYARAIGVREPAAWVTTPDRARVALAGTPAIVVVPQGDDVCTAPAETSGGQAVLRVGATTPPRWNTTGLLDDHEPAAIRLALLRFGPQERAVLSSARLHRAEQTVQRWRSKVAGWADMPAAPAPSDRLDAVRAALIQDLDTPAALTLLHRLETDLDVVSGSKFETFAYADRVLALDLTHLVGRLRR